MKHRYKLKSFSILLGLALVAAIQMVAPASGTAQSDDVANEQDCLTLGSAPIDFGDVTDGDWDSWTGVDLDFAAAEEFLQLNTDGETPTLRQRLVPSSVGSARVVARGAVEPARTYTMTQRVFFEPGFDWGREKQGGKLGFGLAGGTAPTGGDVDPAGFSARFMWRGNGDGTARIALYSYAADRTQNVPYGDNYYLEGFLAPIGEWFTLTMEITANTAGASDGRARAWANGELALDRQGIRWQDAGDTPQVEHMSFATFYGGNSLDWAPESTTYIQFADACWSAGPVPEEPGDEQRRQEGVLQIVEALESYGEANGTYAVEGAGWGERGVGWVFFESFGANYSTSIASVLTEQQGHLSRSVVHDPLWRATTWSVGDVMSHTCGDRVAVFTIHGLGEPSEDDRKWWESNDCDRGPNEDLDTAYFKLSRPLGSSEELRQDAVDEMVKALESYGDADGTYLVEGTGFRGRGSGWVFYEDEAYDYPTSVASVLIERGHLSAEPLRDPLWVDTMSIVGDVLVYRCADRIAVFTREGDGEPSAEDSAWWSDNDCNRYPIDRMGAAYYKLSRPLGPPEELRQDAVDEMVEALESYGEANGAYHVAGSGSRGTGHGWVFYEDKAYDYPTSVASVLIEQGHLSAEPLHDPLWESETSIVGDVLVYRCADRIAAFTREGEGEPSAEDSAWWSGNDCNRYPIDRMGAAYFKLSEPLGPTPDPWQTYDAFVTTTVDAIESLNAVAAFSDMANSSACVGTYPSECNGAWNSTTGTFSDFINTELGSPQGVFAPDTAVRSGGISAARETDLIRIAIFVGADSSKCDTYNLDRNDWSFYYTANDTWQGACIVRIPTNDADGGLVHFENDTQVVAPPGTDEAASILAAELNDSLGWSLEVVDTAPATGHYIELQLGCSENPRDGFTFTSENDRSIKLCASGTTGLTFAVYDFAERYLGVRWLFPAPNDLGTYRPQKRQVTVPRESRAEAPAYVNRRLSAGVVSQDFTPWAHRMRMTTSQSAFHHNLYNIFPPSEYRLTNPEFYPLHSDGVRYPEEEYVGACARDRALCVEENHRWQPVLTAPGITAEAVSNIREYLTSNPDVGWYSLGMNDSTRWGQAQEEGRPLNSLGVTNMSDYYFPWANEVVEAVSQTHPDTRFGLLAYRNLLDPPSTPLNDNIVPYMTFDRMQWADPDRKQADIARTQSWAGSASELGWYDYVYGDQPTKTGAPFYAAPRVYPHLMAEYLRFGRDNGVRHYYAEAYPSTDYWSEGPKLYVLSKLLWNPDLDVDALLADWYEAAVGKPAATYLSNYYARWEEFWTQRVPQTHWFQSSTKDYLNFNSDGYLEVTGEDESYLQTQMDGLRDATRGTAFEERADFFLTAWDHVRTQTFEGPRTVINNGEVPNGYTSFFQDDIEGTTGDLPAEWRFWNRPDVGSTAQASLTTAHQAVGQSSLAVGLNASGLKQAYTVAYRGIEINPEHTQYCLKARVLSPDSTHTLALSFQRTSGAYAFTRDFAYSPSAQWRTSTVCANVPTTVDLTNVRMTLGIRTDDALNAQVWFDDVEIFSKP